MKKKEDILKEKIFKKEQFLKSKKYENDRDILKILLDDGFEYRETEVEEKLKAFKKGVVR